jgi:phosphoribosyl 1,2-cyclic phosphodiesterase
MADNDEFFVRFWGVRGSIACSGPETARYGGNTSCLEVRCGGKPFIFDAGTGLRYLGNALMAENGAVDADIFLTHTHYDHVCGLPFFQPMFEPSNNFRIWAGHLLPEMTVRAALQEMMMAPLFPVPIEVLRSKPTYNDFHAGDVLEPAAGVTVRTALLNHPNRATGYRIEYGGKSICYVTDTEHVPEGLDENILGLIQGSNIFIYDSMYTEEELPNHTGWGHSTWEQGVKLSEAAGVGLFVVFHHDPDHDDDFLDGVAAALAQRLPASVVARDGMVLAP